MAKIGRPGLPSDRRQQVWEMWKDGSSISEISRPVGSPPGSTFSILLPYGGLNQAPQRRRQVGEQPMLRDYVADRLREDWSPEQLAGVLKKRHPAGSGMQVSHEPMYKSLFLQFRGVLSKELEKRPRSGRPIRRSVRNTVTGQTGFEGRP